MATAMDRRLRERARTPRYTIPEAAGLVGRPAETVRRWTFGHERDYRGKPTKDKPLVIADGELGADALALSFLNVLELHALSFYRGKAPLQAIRRALAYAGIELGVDRPLESIEFRVHGGELFTRFAEAEDGASLLLNASRGGQTTFARLVESLTDDIDYDEETKTTAQRWWFKTRSVPVLIDTRVADGHPITAQTGLRLDAILSRHRDGLTAAEIQHDTGATETEVVATIALAA